MSSAYLLYDTVDHTAWMRMNGSFTTRRRLGARSECDIRLFSTDITLTDGRPLEGKEITIIVDSHVEFGGIISKAVERIPGGESQQKMYNWDIYATDYAQYLDRRRIITTYTGMTAGDMIRDAWSRDFGSGTALLSEGITVSSVQDGPVISDILNFAGVTFSEFMDTLCKITGYVWYVDWLKILHFETKTTPDAPWSVIDASPFILKESISIETNSDEYANRILVRIPADATGTYTETFFGFSPAMSFYTAYAIGEEPEIYRGSPGVKQNVGLYPEWQGTPPVDQGYNWYWAEGSQAITQDVDDAPLADGESLTVIYKPIFSNIIAVQDTDEMATRALLEGGSGLHEILIDYPEADSIDAAVSFGQAQLDKRKSVTRRVTYQTRSYGIDPGMVQIVDSGAHSILIVPFLVESVDGAWDDEHGMVYTVTCVDHGDKNSWVKAMAEAFNDSSSGATTTHFTDWEHRLKVEDDPISTGTRVCLTPFQVILDGPKYGVRMVDYQASVLTGPASGDVVVTIVYTRDSGVTWDTVFTVTIPSGQYTSPLGKTFTTSELNHQDFLQANIVSTGGTGGLEVVFRGAKFIHASPTGVLGSQGPVVP